jgi:hypothetical protein
VLLSLSLDARVLYEESRIRADAASASALRVELALLANEVEQMVRLSN